MMKRFASRVVLAFDADSAGQGAAEKFYEWEAKYQVQVSVARFPDGLDPGELSQRDPGALRQAVDDSLPFLGFRLQRLWQQRTLRSPEDRARGAGDAMAIVNEHPNPDVRKLYAGEIALRVGLPVGDLVAVAQRGSARPRVQVQRARHVGSSENAEFVAVATLLQRWNDIANWLIEELFVDDVARRAFLAVAAAGGSIQQSIELADPEARELLERAAVADLEVEPFVEAANLISAAVRRELSQRVRVTDPVAIMEAREARISLESLDDPVSAGAAAGVLLGWLQRCNEERE